MKKGICYLIGAGECNRLLLQLNTEDFVIAVDGGYEYVKDQRVDLVVGDFDSLGYLPKHENVIQLRPEKDDTDMRVAIREGLKAGYHIFCIYGACGGRFEHTVANIQSLAYIAGQGARGFLYDKDTVITMIQDDVMHFSSSMKGYLSVFAYGERAKGVTLKGLKYPLDNAELTNDFPLGVSNEFMGIPSEISVQEGRLLLVYKV